MTAMDPARSTAVDAVPRIVPASSQNRAFRADSARIAGSENFDRTFSGNSDHAPVALPDQKIVGDSVSDEGKDDRHAQTTRNPGPAAGGPHVDRGGGAERGVDRDGATRRGRGPRRDRR